MSPTQRTLDRCRKFGWNACVAEYWHAFAKQRMDLFGFIDVVALTGSHIVGIQATTGNHVSARRDKILYERSDNALAWLESGGVIEVWGWKQYKKKAPGDNREWRERRVMITRKDFDL